MQESHSAKAAQQGAGTARSLALAQAAEAKMREHGHPPIPRHYEIWYGYVTATNRALIEAIDETLARAGGLSDADLERIYEAHLSPIGLAGRVNKASDGIGVEL